MVKNRKEISIEDDAGKLLAIGRIYPSPSAALDRAILARAAACRRQGRRNFFIRHVMQYSAMAAAVGLCFLVPLYFAEHFSMDNLTTPRTAAVQWDWKAYAPLDELNSAIEGISNMTRSGTTTNYYDSELTLETVIESINSYEVIL